MKTLNINEIANLVGKTIKWQAPAAEGNETYGGIARIIGVNKEERFPITVETVSGDNLHFAFVDSFQEDGTMSYSDDDRYVTYELA